MRLLASRIPAVASGCSTLGPGCVGGGAHLRQLLWAQLLFACWPHLPSVAPAGSPGLRPVWGLVVSEEEDDS